MKQSSFSDLAYEHKKKTTRKERFLSEMEAILPWDELLKPILKHYPKPGKGRQPIPAQVMLRLRCKSKPYVDYSRMREKTTGSNAD